MDTRMGTGTLGCYFLFSWGLLWDMGYVYVVHGLHGLYE